MSANDGIPTECIPVSLDLDLVRQLLEGLHSGAAGKTLKVVISTDGSYHVSSKDLRMTLKIDETHSVMTGIEIHNTKQRAVISSSDLNSMGFTSLANDVVKELQSKYSPVFHSLADNIVVFNRTYCQN